MKKLTLTLLAGLSIAATSFAGQEMKEYKAVPEPCFKDTELQLDLFASYSATTPSNSNHGDGFGGGLGVNYFFTRNLGISVSGNIYDGDANGVWNVDADLVLRFPIEGAICIAPYILAGGGVETNGSTVGTWNAGGGLEWRATHTIGIFGEGRYIWAGDDEDGVQARLGLRFVF